MEGYTIWIRRTGTWESNISLRALWSVAQSCSCGFLVLANRYCFIFFTAHIAQNIVAQTSVLTAGTFHKQYCSGSLLSSSRGASDVNILHGRSCVTCQLLCWTGPHFWQFRPAAIRIQACWSWSFLLPCKFQLSPNEFGVMGHSATPANMHTVRSRQFGSAIHDCSGSPCSQGAGWYRVLGGKLEASFFLWRKLPVNLALFLYSTQCVKGGDSL